MNHRLAVLAVSLCCAVAAHAAGAMSKDLYKAQQLRIEAEYDAMQARCKPHKGVARDVCNEQARGNRDIQAADLEFRYKPTADNDEKLRVAKAEAAYAVSLQRCKEMDGNAKDVCRKDAKAVLAGAKAEAKLQKEVMAQQFRSNDVVRERTEIAERQTEAQFAAARERCEMLPGEGRENCLLDARKRFGKL
jgi:hypothetical protein